MTYFKPYIDAAGLHIPSYTDIRDKLVQAAKDIFGSDIYLGNDSQDYQYISSVALIASDTHQAAQLVYNNRGPGTAIGSGLDGIIKLNGIKRKTPSYSTCKVKISGVAGTTITNGVVQDVGGTNWNLPSVVTIGSNGTVTTTATCQEIGAVTSLPGDISKIVTPTKGWTSVVNEVAAVPGQPVESESAVRARQAISVANPSRSMLEGTKGGIAGITGVTRFEVYENDTSIIDEYGLPPHSITAVVEGGTDQDIAQVICLRKGPGCYTNGTTTVNTIDTFGSTMPIRFYRPTYKNTAVSIDLKALTGYTTATESAIKDAAVEYLNSLAIGVKSGSVLVSSVWGAALSAMPDLKKPIFSIQSVKVGIVGQTLGTSDIPMAFNEVAAGDVENITISLVS